MTTWLMAAGFGVVCGCASPEPSAPGERSTTLRPCGRVLRARPSDGWVVLECVVCPPVGAVVPIMRGTRPVGHVQITGRRTGEFVIAEILDGEARTGDWIGPP